MAENERASPIHDVDDQHQPLSDLRSRVLSWIADGNKGRLLEYFIAVGVFIDTLSSGMVVPILPAFADLFQLEQAAITSLLALRGFTSIASAAPIGLSVAWIGHRNILLLSFFGTIAACLLLARPPSWHFLAFALFLQGLCSELAWTTGLSLAANLYGGDGEAGKQQREGSKSSDESDSIKKRVGTDVETWLSEPLLMNGSGSGSGSSEEIGQNSKLIGSIGTLFGMASIGYLLGPFAGAVLYQYTAPWIPFALVALLTLLVTVALFLLTSGESLFGKGMLKVSILPDEGEKDEVSAVEAVDDKLASHELLHSEPSLLQTFVTVSKNPTILSLLAVSVVTLVSFGALEVLLPFFLRRECQMDTAQVGLVFGVSSVAYFIATVKAEQVVDISGPTASILMGLLFQAAVQPIIFLRNPGCNLLAQSLLMLCAGIAIAVSSTPVFPIIVEVFGELGFNDYAVIVAMYNVSFTLGSALGPLFAAGLKVYMEPASLISLASLFILSCIPVVWWGRRKAPQSNV